MLDSFNDFNSRVIFSQGKLSELFSEVERITDKRPSDLASLLNVSTRTVRDWKREKHSINLGSLLKLCQLSSLPFPNDTQIKPQYWQNNLAGKKGGLAQFRKHKTVGGDPTLRLAKWRHWWEHEGKFQKSNTSVLQRHNVSFPKYSAELAEFVGILLGDGGISKYQITITLNWQNDHEYLYFVQQLCLRLFTVECRVIKRAKESVGNIVISRRDLVEFFVHMGLVVGNKVRQQVRVPAWIIDDPDYIKCCIRGLVDTDGSFYVDRHTHATTTYFNGGLNFTNRSLPLLSFVKHNLEKIGFHPTQKTPYSIFLRRESEIHRYFEIIGTSNQKHFNKFQKYVILRQKRRSTKAVTMAPTRNRLVP